MFYINFLFITQSLTEVTVLKAMSFKNFDKFFLCFALLYSKITSFSCVKNAKRIPKIITGSTVISLFRPWLIS